MVSDASKPTRRRAVSIVGACGRPWSYLLSSVVLCLAASAVLSPLFAADQVRIGVARTISDVGYYVADAMGFFRDEGLAVSIVGFNSAAQMVAPLGTGELEVGGGRCRRASTMRSSAAFHEDRCRQGLGQAGIRFFLAAGAQGPCRIRPLQELADLKGMKIAVGAQGTGSASSLNEALKQGGLKFSDVEVVYHGASPRICRPTRTRASMPASPTSRR